MIELCVAFRLPVRFFALVGCMLAPIVSSARAAEILVEAESFQELGGWKLDTQFIQQMGSPYLLAHGLGTPVNDATTTVQVAEAGEYHVWVRTYDWVARWDAPGTPGRFSLSINDNLINDKLGTEGKQWQWQHAGKAKLSAGTAKLKLHDLTGFDGVVTRFISPRMLKQSLTTRAMSFLLGAASC